jgi:hypothetical protein
LGVLYELPGVEVRQTKLVLPRHPIGR